MEHVCTVDFSANGAQLAGVRARLRVGDTLQISYHERTSRFHIRWLAPASSTSAESHVGVECLQPAKGFWPVERSVEDAHHQESSEVCVSDISRSDSGCNRHTSKIATATRQSAALEHDPAHRPRTNRGERNPSLLRSIIGLFMLELPSNPRRTALAIAILADAVQIVFFPMFVEGAFSPLDDLLDIMVAWLLIRLLGWHWAFLPSFVVKVLPSVDLVPTWTMAVLVATRSMPSEQAKIEPPIIEGRP